MRHPGILPILEDVVEIGQIFFLQKAKAADQTSDTSRRISTSGKANQEDAVTVCVVVGEEAVGFSDIFRNALSSATSNHVVGNAHTSAHTSLVVDDLRVMVSVLSLDGATDPGDVGGDLSLGGTGEPAALLEAIVAILMPKLVFGG